MKCPKCDGKGEYFHCDADGMYDVRCEQCNGKGMVNDDGTPIVTHEEYIRTCNFDQLAEVLTELMLSEKRYKMVYTAAAICTDKYHEMKMWLKEKHK